MRDDNEVGKTAHQNYADSLRLIAAFIEAHQEIPLPFRTIKNFSVTSKEDAANVIRALGSCKKVYDDTIFRINKNFGDITMSFVFLRNEVCTRREVGKEMVPEQVTPAHEKTIYAWDCEPILEPTESAA